MVPRVALALLLLLALSLPDAALAKGRKKTSANERTSKQERTQCEEGPCSEWDADYKPNCVLRCQSEACYSQTYEGSELEPGEIDAPRSRKYQQCLSSERAARTRAASKRGRRGR